MNGWHEMLQCICFPSLLKQKVIFLLHWLALAAGDGDDATLSFPAVSARLAPYTWHLPRRGTAVCRDRVPSGSPSLKAWNSLLFPIQEPTRDGLITHQLL